jgi:hypothetical protein
LVVPDSAEQCEAQVNMSHTISHDYYHPWQGLRKKKKKTNSIINLAYSATHSLGQPFHQGHEAGNLQGF